MNLSSSPFPQKLFLVGMMGTGKSKVGLQFSKRFNLSFYDIDNEIEKMTGLSIPEIFAKHGENEFRKMERSFVDSHLPKENCVVSCGGGLCIPEGMLEKLKKIGLVVCLWAEPLTIYTRIIKNKNRPLIDKGNEVASIKEILKTRKNRYLSAHKVVVTDEKSIEEIIDEVAFAYSSNKKV